ncbi:MAG: glycosyltransferase family 2 protein [Mucilaginibacter sp.]|nr:glycosyltransferase family 2 protein [Mucilaginibacter sp.]
MNQIDIAASIVLYNNDRKMLKAAIDSFLAVQLKIRLYLIDNSPTDVLKDLIVDERVVYKHNPSNPGFGAGHNIAIKDIGAGTAYFLVLNPDIYFEKGVVENILSYMYQNQDVGVVMPKILYPDGEIQYVAKLLPTISNFLIRRFIPIKALTQKKNEEFELKKSNYDTIIEAPFLSGCFMIFRQDVLLKIDGFDENIFMYTEDIDICRRVIRFGLKCIFYPVVSVFHDHEKKSFLKYKTLKVYLRSAIYYFNKYGWFFDRERESINRKTLKQFVK